MNPSILHQDMGKCYERLFSFALLRQLIKEKESKFNPLKRLTLCYTLLVAEGLGIYMLPILYMTYELTITQHPFSNWRVQVPAEINIWMTASSLFYFIVNLEIYEEYLQMRKT